MVLVLAPLGKEHVRVQIQQKKKHKPSDTEQLRVDSKVPKVD